MSEVGKAKGGFSGTFEIGSKTKKSGEKRVSVHRRGVPDVRASRVSTKPRDLSTHGVKHRANLEGDKVGHKIGGFPIYGSLTREERKRVEHNDTMEREDGAQLMSLLQGQGFISEDGICNEPGILEYFNDEIGGVDRLIKSINESDTSYTSDGKTRLYTADKDGITINFKQRGDYEVNSRECKGTEYIELNPPLKLSWNDVVALSSEGKTDRCDQMEDLIMYLFFPVFKDVSGLPGSKPEIKSVLMNSCIISGTRFYSQGSLAFKHAEAQLEEKIASFEKEGNKEAAVGAKNALQYLDLVRDWASKNEVSSGDSLDEKLPENVLKVLDRIITDAGEAKVSDKELQQADLLLKIITPETIDKADRFLAGIKNGSSFNTKNIEAADFVGKLENIPNINNIADVAAGSALDRAFRDIKDAVKVGIDGTDHSKLMNIGKGGVNKNKNVDMPQGDVFGKILKDIKDGGPTDTRPLASKLAGKVGANKRAAVNKNKIAGGAADAGNVKKASGIPKSLKNDLEQANKEIHETYLPHLKVQQETHVRVTTKKNLEKLLKDMEEKVSKLQISVGKYGVESDPYVGDMMKSIKAGMQELRSVGNELLNRPRWG